MIKRKINIIWKKIIINHNFDIRRRENEREILKDKIYIIFFFSFL